MLHDPPWYRTTLPQYRTSRSKLVADTLRQYQTSRSKRCLSGTEICSGTHLGRGRSWDGYAFGTGTHLGRRWGHVTWPSSVIWSKTSCGSCVVLPQPVSPDMTTT
eukprot:964801-Rhodomonas_salina.1